MAYNRWEILKRDRFRCAYCGRQAAETELHVDHVHPRSKGGSDHPSNLKTACRACNLSKRNKEIEWRPCYPIMSLGGHYPANIPEWWDMDDDRDLPGPFYLSNPRQMASDGAFHSLHSRMRKARGRGDRLLPEDLNDFTLAYESTERSIWFFYGAHGLGRHGCDLSGWRDRWHPNRFALVCSEGAVCL